MINRQLGWNHFLHSVHVNMNPCSSMRHVQNIGVPVTFNTGFYQFFVVGSVCIDFSVFWSKWHCSCTFVVQKNEMIYQLYGERLLVPDHNRLRSRYFDSIAKFYELS